MHVELPQVVQQFIEDSKSSGRVATPAEAVASMVSFYRSNYADVSRLRAELQMAKNRARSPLSLFR